MSSMVRPRSSPPCSLPPSSSPVPALAQWDQGRDSLVAQQPGPGGLRGQPLGAADREPELHVRGLRRLPADLPGLPRRGHAARLCRSAPRRPVRRRRPAGRVLRPLPAADQSRPRAIRARADGAAARRGARDRARRLARRADEPDRDGHAVRHYGASFTPADHDARMDALLWQRDPEAAALQMPYVSQARAPVVRRAARDPPGRRRRDATTAARAERPRLPVEPQPRAAHRGPRCARRTRCSPRVRRSPRAPFNPTAWVEEHLAVARAPARRLGAADRRARERGLRREARDRRRPLQAARRLHLADVARRHRARCGTSATATPPRRCSTATAPPPRPRRRARRASSGPATPRSRPATRPRRRAITRWPRPIPSTSTACSRSSGSAGPRPRAADARRAAHARAARRLPRQPAGRRRCRSSPAAATPGRPSASSTSQLANQAQNEAEHAAGRPSSRSELNLPELAVVVGRVAPEKGFAGFTQVGFPTVPTPAEADWTMVHAIARQESEFDNCRTSHAGATGLMQLMPGTAREQAGKLGMAYMSASLNSDPQYNIRLGNGYFQRMMDNYGSYPLAVAAYNAGPGNVNKWLRANGDPRTGGDQLDRLDRADPDLRDQELRPARARERRGLRDAAPRQGGVRPRARDQRVPALSPLPLAGGLRGGQCAARWRRAFARRLCAGAPSAWRRAARSD